MLETCPPLGMHLTDLQHACAGFNIMESGMRRPFGHDSSLQAQPCMPDEVHASGRHLVR